MRTELVETALRNAAATAMIEPDAIFHSDRGSVYTSAGYRALVAGLGMPSSMGRTGVCWDNAMAESFFSALKNERVHRTVYATKERARRDVIAYIEGVLQQPPPALRPRLPQAQRGPLQLPTASTGSVRETNQLRCPKTPRQPSQGH